MRQTRTRTDTHATAVDRPTIVSGARQRLLALLPLSERRLRLNGVATAILEGGDGPPLVLLHGPGEYAAKWLRVIPDLVSTHRVIAPDLPGHGASDPMDGHIDAERVLGWVDDLIECTCATHPILVGHLLGGAIAARFAIASHERMRALVLVNTFGLAPFQPAPEFAAALTNYNAEPTEETHDRLWSRCAFDLETMRRRLGQHWDALKAYNLDRAHTPALHGTQQSLMEEFGISAIPPSDLSRIAVPTTLIWGRHDLATPLRIAQDASARFGWRLHIVEQAGDDPPLEQPESFVRALRAALDNPTERAATDGSPSPSDAWDRIAPGYDRTNTPTQMRIAYEGLRRADLRAGMRFLDVASGSGALSIPAARLGARVVAIDQSAVMLRLLGARAGAEGLDIDTRVMDGHALQLGDDSFDVVGSQFGVMLFRDMPKAIREMVRVASPGGRVLLHAYGNPHEIEFLGFLVAAVQSVRPDFDGPPMDPPPLEFQLADPEGLRAELSRAGLKTVHVETVTEVTEHETGKDLWEWLVWSNPIVEHVLGDMLELTNDERSIVQRTLDTLVRERAGGGRAAKLTNPVNIGVGVK
jgi:pimeloyl-ACP methyl ester carboxylesterase/ubiquinone/menaquinone biosynthesis C-methylase UbiE